MWNHEAEHGEGGNGKEVKEIWQQLKGPKRNGLLQRKHISNQIKSNQVLFSHTYNLQYVHFIKSDVM